MSIQIPGTFREMSHQVVFVVAEFTALLGDPRAHDSMHRGRSRKSTATMKTISRSLPTGGGTAAASGLIAPREADQLQRAGDFADHALELAPWDPEALIVQGRVYLAWPRIGRAA